MPDMFLYYIHIHFNNYANVKILTTIKTKLNIDVFEMTGVF